MTPAPWVASYVAASSPGWETAMVVHQNRSPNQRDLYTKQRRFLNITLLTLTSPDKDPKGWRTDLYAEIICPLNLEP